MITTTINIEKLKKKILRDLLPLGEAENVHFRLGHCRKGADNFRIELEALTVLSDGTISDPEKTKFEAYAADYDLKPEWFGKEFVAKGSKFKITGINPKAPRFPVNVTKITDGSSWKFTVPSIKLAMKGQTA
jgi:hypothetical protein